jgi:hypothetical protein
VHGEWVDEANRPTQDLLAEYAEILNTHGPDSTEQQAFLKAHADNTEFVGLAETSRIVKKRFVYERDRLSMIVHLARAQVDPPWVWCVFWGLTGFLLGIGTAWALLR